MTRFNLFLAGAAQVGVNPKVNNIYLPYQNAKHDILWILDSNVYVDPYCLLRSVKLLNEPNVGLVHHLPCGVEPKTFGSKLEMLFLNSSHAKLYMAINWFRLSSCIVGKSNLFRKSSIEKSGMFIGVDYC